MEINLQISARKKGEGSKINLKDRDSEEQIEKEDTANYINTFFSTIADKLSRKFNGQWRFYDKEQEDSCEPFSTDFQQAMKLCKEIHTRKSWVFMT